LVEDRLFDNTFVSH